MEEVGMWITTEEGKLLNLDHVEQISIQGTEVRAQYSDGQRSDRVIRPTKGTPQEYMQALGTALAGEARHVDVSHL